MMIFFFYLKAGACHVITYCLNFNLSNLLRLCWWCSYLITCRFQLKSVFLCLRKTIILTLLLLLLVLDNCYELGNIFITVKYVFIRDVFQVASALLLRLLMYKDAPKCESHSILWPIL